MDNKVINIGSEGHECIGIYDWFGGKNVFVCLECGYVKFIYHDENRVPRMETVSTGNPNVSHHAPVAPMINLTNEQLGVVFGEGINEP